MQEVIPFVKANFSIRPERDALALLGSSAGGYRPMSLAIRHRDTIGVVATVRVAHKTCGTWNCQ